MSQIKIRSRNTDYDAAQALLDLQGNSKSERSRGPNVWSGTEGKEDMEKTAKLIWSCFISSDIEPPAPSNRKNLRYIDSTSQLPSKRLCYPNEKTDTSYDCSILNTEKAAPSFFIETNPAYAKQNETRRDSFNKINGQENRQKQTREIGTQTEEAIHPNIILMENTIKNLCDKIKSLEAQIKVNNSDVQLTDNIERLSSGTDNVDDYSLDNEDDDPNYDDAMNDTIYEPKYIASQQSYHAVSGIQTGRNVLSRSVLTNHSVNAKLCDRVPIGDGHATVPSRLLKHINWNSYSSATRKLLTAVFSRRVLATHSLTGKPSPAFPNKPAKKRLDPALVNDIVQTVVERCSVPENVVRTSITTKCADESKMLRTRQKNNKKRTSKKNRENVPPSSSESESDDF